MTGPARAALQSPFGLVADLGAAVAAELGISDAQIAAWLGYVAGNVVGTVQARAAVVRGRRELTSRRSRPAAFRAPPLPVPRARPTPAVPAPAPQPVAPQAADTPGPEPDPVPAVAEPVDAKAAKEAADRASIARAVAAVLQASVKPAPSSPG